MGIGGTGSTNQSTNPNTMYSPVSYGGNIISGDIGNGPIGISGQTTAEGGKFDFKLDMPVPMQLQNLGMFNDIARYTSPAYHIAEAVRLQNLLSIGDFSPAYKLAEAVSLQNLDWLGDIGDVVSDAAQVTSPLFAIANDVVLQNLDFFSDLGSGLEKASKIGSSAYKIGKKVAPVAGGMWEKVDSKSYDKYAVPATKGFVDVKNVGKSVGGWNTLGAIGGAMNPSEQAPAPVAQGPTQEQIDFQNYLAFKAAQGQLILLNL